MRSPAVFPLGQIRMEAASRASRASGATHRGTIPGLDVLISEVAEFGIRIHPVFCDVPHNV